MMAPLSGGVMYVPARGKRGGYMPHRAGWLRGRVAEERKGGEREGRGGKKERKVAEQQL